jgi:PKD repeat protein
MKKHWINALIALFIPICLIAQNDLPTPADGSTSSQEKAARFGKAFFDDETRPQIERGICTTMEMDALLRENNPGMGTLEEFEMKLQEEIARYNEGLISGRIADEILTIPVIVHVIHNGEPVGVGPNITAEQVQSQIDAMNEHFRKVGTGANDNPAGADIEIEFAPAIWNPNGQRMAEPGVDRVDGNKEDWDQLNIQAVLKERTIWDPFQYFNIWTVKFGDQSQGLLGYAQFPNSSGLDGLGENEGTESTDGVVMNYRTFGTTSNVPKPYHQGKVTSHEVGHWLGLRHVWGDGKCNVDDYCDDTPNCSDARWSSMFLGCPTDDECGGGLRPVDNYMDYSDDPCKKVFTNNQKTRMRTVMDVSPRRKELRDSRVHLERDTPYPFFTASQTIGCEGVIIQFNDTSANNPTSWAWSFFDDDGNLIGESNEQHPQQLFEQIGHYDVELIASNDAGSSTLREEHYIAIISNSFVSSVSENFEDSSSALQNWLVYNPDNDRTFQYADFSAYGIGSKSVFFDNYNTDDDPAGTWDALITPKFDLTSSTNPYLSFDHAYAAFGASGGEGDTLNINRGDTLAIMYSIDCGETFMPLWSKGGDELSTSPRTVMAFEPENDEWENTQISLADLLGNSSVHFAFVHKSQASNNMYLDNLAIGDFSGSNPPSPVTIRYSDTVVCEGSYVRFEDQTPEFPTSWNWTFEGGNPSTSTSQNPVVGYDAAGIYDVILEVTNSVGTEVDTFQNIIMVDVLPSVTITPDQTDYCPGDKITLNGSGAEHYTWYDERSVDPASFDSTYTTLLFRSRTFYLVGENAGGCADTTSYEVVLQTGADVSIQASDTIVCGGDTVLFTAAGGESYIWFFNKDTISTDASVEIPFYLSDVVGIQGITSAGCPGFDVSEITVLNTPVAEITVEGDILTASDADSYQWYLDGTEIPDATSKIYVAEESGDYHVIVFNANGCSDASESVSIDIITGLDDLENSVSISVYPNPNTGKFMLRITGSMTGRIEYQMMNVTGKIIQSGVFDKQSGTSEIDMDLNDDYGIYLLKLINGDQTEIIRLIRN